MPRRFLTAREQLEMLEPWLRTADVDYAAQAPPKAAAWLHQAGHGDEIYEHIQRSPGGITWSPDGPPPSHGYMVSLPHAEKKIPFDQLSPHEIDQYLHEHPEISHEKPYGGWHAPPNWVHDVSKNIPDDYHAKGNAVDWGQDAVFDLDAPMKPHTDEPVDQAYVDTNPWVNSGPASALGWTHAKRRT